VRIWDSQVGLQENSMTSILDKLEEARQSEREKIFNILKERFPLWVSTHLRKILKEKSL
jgi:hypothetical protein